MRRATVRDLRPGMTLARAVRSDRGELLLAAHVPLTDRYIDMLRTRGFSTVFVDDPDTDDVEIEDILSERVRAKVTASLCRVFDAMERAAGPLRDLPPRGVEEELQAPEVARAVQEHGSYHTLREDIEDLVDEVLAADVLSGMNTLRSFDSYQFVHALDSTVTSVMLGRRLHFPPDDLRRIASGCLLHDIGMVAVDRAILDKQGPLTNEERDRLRLHPQVGYEMLRKLRPTEVLANHVAYQHHERQDGTGYPRGLHGNNRAGRSTSDRAAANRIVMDAEIVAVADVYDALGADRPYRAALAPDQAVRTVRRLAGGQLNREIVAQLVAVLPIYPLGVEVVVMTGEYQRWRGIVSRVHKEALDRPTVRLLVSPDRGRINPIEIDLRTGDDVIACVPIGGRDAAPSAASL